MSSVHVFPDKSSRGFAEGSVPADEDDDDDALSVFFRFLDNFPDAVALVAAVIKMDSRSRSDFAAVKASRSIASDTLGTITAGGVLCLWRWWCLLKALNFNT